MLRTFIVDDDLPNIDLIQGMANRYCPELQIVGSATSVEQAVAGILKSKPHLVFLDIQLHDENGFEVLDAIRTIEAKIIIVSAYENYALKAIKCNVSDYLMKPVRIADFRNAVSKILAEHKDYEKPDALPDPEKAFYLALPDKNQLNIIRSEHIIRLEARSNYTRIYTDDNSVYTTSKTLGDYEHKLPPEQFIRVHKSHIINLNHINNYHRCRNGHLIMNDASEIPIAASRRKEVMTRIIF